MPDVPSQEQLKRLPKWAQHCISDLARDNDRLRKRFAAVTQPVDSETSILWADGIVGETHGLPEHSNVRLRLKRDRRDGYVECNIQNDTYGERIAVISTGTSPMRIEPRAANCIHIYIEK